MYRIVSIVLVVISLGFVQCAVADDCVVRTSPHLKKFKGAKKSSNENQIKPDGGATECDSYEVKDSLKIRFGKLEAITAYEGAPFATIIMLNGKKVFEGGRDVVNLGRYFQIKDKDVVLLESGSTGSGTPDDELFFLVIESATSSHIVTDRNFVADFGIDDKKDVSMDKLGRIIVNLGYRGGEAVIAEFDSINLRILAKPVLNASLKDADCKTLFEMSLRECAEYKASGQSCSILKDNSSIFVTGVDMSSYSYISNLPGYNDAGFKMACFAWCEGKNTTYQEFQKTSCKR